MIWTRRSFLSGLGLATLAAACRREGPAPDRRPPPLPGGTDLVDPGWDPVHGRAPFQCDGDELVELFDGALIRRDAKRAELWRVAIADARSFAVLPDHSVVVLAEPKTGRVVHHVIDGKLASTQPHHADTILPMTSPTSYWAVSSWVEQVDLVGTAKHDQVPLPENTNVYASDVLSDGSIAMANLWGILRFAPALTTFKWDKGNPSHVGAGPDATTVWAASSPHIMLASLANDRATPVATHTLVAGEELVHFAGKGAHAAAIIAHTVGPHRAACSLVVYDQSRELWRAPLGEHRSAWVALSATRVAARLGAIDHASSLAPGLLRSWDLATGTEQT
ncbi:MAG: hypothetical protein ABI591_05870 [Kofleriaceae bacterium]